MAWMPWLRDWVEQLARAGKTCARLLGNPLAQASVIAGLDGGDRVAYPPPVGLDRDGDKKQRLGDSAGAVTTAGPDGGNDDLDERGTESAKLGRAPR
jgi:hypothetical protein